MKLFKKQQSILITGVSGSGKTENGKHIVEFLCHTKCDSQNIIDSGQIFEAFGNARTRGNSNSSRFCKHMEVFDQSYYSFFFVSIHFNWFPIIGYVWCRHETVWSENKLPFVGNKSDLWCITVWIELPCFLRTAPWFDEWSFEQNMPWSINCLQSKYLIRYNQKLLLNISSFNFLRLVSTW